MNIRSTRNRRYYPIASSASITTSSRILIGAASISPATQISFRPWLSARIASLPHALAIPRAQGLLLYRSIASASSSVCEWKVKT
jgi:hypothetical protein